MVVFWVTLEVYAKEFHKHQNEEFVPVNLGLFTRLLRRRWNTVDTILKFFQDKKRIFYKIEGKYLYLKIPKFSILADEYTRIKKFREVHNDNEMITRKKRDDNDQEVEVEVDKSSKDIKEKDNTFAPSEKKHSLVAPITFDFETRKWIGITDQDFTDWQVTYPAVNVENDLSKMAMWLLGNPLKKKSQYRRFITNWLNRTQERGGTRGGK